MPTAAAAANLRRLPRRIAAMKRAPNPPPRGIYLAPMVRGSELAFRTLARRHGGASLCYSPMLRDRDVVAASAYSLNHFSQAELAVDGAGRTDPVEETAHLMLRDADRTDVENLVVQLCGSRPGTLARATTAALDVYSRVGAPPAGIDLNLGCPQECASREGFGAFLVERDPGAAVACLSSMREAIDAHPCGRASDGGSRPRLSAKIRLLDDGVDDTIAFVRKLQSAGADYVAIHCRRRADKHDGTPDWEAGGKIAAALSPDLPIILNGGIMDREQAALVADSTGCHAVMVATGYLRDHRSFDPSPAPQASRHGPEHLALEYLDFAERHPPPSHLYVQKHLRWIFRAALRPEDDPTFDGSNFVDWRVRLWSFLVRPYLRDVEQFRLFVALYVRLRHGVEDGRRAPESIRRLVPEVSFGSVKRAGRTRTRGDRVWRCDE